MSKKLPPDDDDVDPQVLLELAEKVAREVVPFFVGLSGRQVGYVLAELIAIWLGGHVVVNEDNTVDTANTAHLRAELLKVCIETSHHLLHSQHDITKASPQETKQ